MSTVLEQVTASHDGYCSRFLPQIHLLYSTSIWIQPSCPGCSYRYSLESLKIAWLGPQTSDHRHRYYTGMTNITSLVSPVQFLIYKAYASIVLCLIIFSHVFV